jgi:hypothetical protein
VRRAVVVLVLSTVLVAVGTPPADAASTRAEYIAQVDPICQTFAGPLGDAWGAFHRNFKGMLRAAKSGNFKRFLKGTKRMAVSLNGISQTRTSMIDQIAAVPPLAGDAGTVGTWLGYLRQEGGLEGSAASALRRLQIAKSFHRLRRADKASAAGIGAISGFGFQVCGTFPVV